MLHTSQINEIPRHLRTVRIDSLCWNHPYPDSDPMYDIFAIEEENEAVSKFYTPCVDEY